MAWTGRFSRILTMTLALGATSGAVAAEDGAWRVSKSSGEVWMTVSGAQPASLGQQEVLKPGDTIRTGRNGRVLLVRGDETILVSPNSVIGLPTEQKDGLSTTILQQAGSILLEVEKKNVKHFEVETPYLAAVVKGTHFSVSVNAASTSVNVLRGQVEVADFRSGQIAQVMPGQAATAFAHGQSGLSLSGTGTLQPIEQGKPRASSIERIMVPKTGLAAPRNAANGQSIRALSHVAAGSYPGTTRPGAIRISAAVGEVRLNFHRVTHGLARGSVVSPGSARHLADRDTIWTSHQTGSSEAGSANSGSGNAAASISSAATASSVAAQVASATASAVNSGSSGNSNDNNGNANGNGRGNANGNGQANNTGNGNGNGNNGNGNGNGNNGNGHGHGH
jgi:hypothetical protein